MNEELDFILESTEENMQKPLSILKNSCLILEQGKRVLLCWVV